MSQTDNSNKILIKNKLTEQQVIPELLTKDEKLDKVFWFKFVFSFVVGIMFGVLNFSGFISFVI